MHKILKSGAFLFLLFASSTCNLHYFACALHFSVAGGPNAKVLNCGSFIMLHFLHSVVL